MEDAVAIRSSAKDASRAQRSTRVGDSDKRMGTHWTARRCWHRDSRDFTMTSRKAGVQWIPNLF